MIIVRLQGGLGNQMFQYAFGRQLAVLRNTSLFLDISYLSNPAEHTKRNYELDIFNISAQFAGEGILNKFENIRKSAIKSRLQPFFPSLFPYHIVYHPSPAFNADLFNSPENLLLIGFWQSEKYFENIKNIIREDFTFKPLQRVEDIALSENIKGSNSISIHFRRGDYVSNAETNKYHGTCNPEYYTAALNYIKSRVKDIHLFIFSDDIDWVKQNMSFDIPVTYVENNKGKCSHIDMQLMAMCKHNIIANSSYSWWGAWLNNNQGKVVVAPKNWFADKTIDTSDLIPASWIRI